MSVEIWYGRWPETESEQDALIELYQFLEPQEEHFLVLVQFHAGVSNEIDWTIVKSNGIFIVEIKHAWDKLVGGTEGDWKIICPDGREIKLHYNPFKQVQHAYWKFTEWCVQNERQITAGANRSFRPDFKKGARSYILVTPDLNPQSEVEVPPPTEILGPQKFMMKLLMRSVPTLALSRPEIERIPDMLKLKKWNRGQAGSKAAEPPETIRIDPGWMPDPFTGLVALGGADSAPLLNFEKLGKEAITIGRDSENDLVIEHNTVSRYHARIERKEGWYVITDLGSQNGTYVNFKGEPTAAEVQLNANEVRGLRNHSLIRIGEVRFLFLLHQ